MIIPDTLTPDQEEILITLRALAGLVATALRRMAALDSATETDALEQVRADVRFWRAFLFHHTRRLLPTVAGSIPEQDCHRFAEVLIRTVYLEDQEALACHGRDRGGHNRTAQGCR